MMKRTMVMVSALLVWGGCDPDELEQQDRDLVVIGPGGDDGGDDGSDEAEEEWSEGAPQVCEPVPVDDQALALDGTLDDLAAPAEIAAGEVACPMNGVASTTYIDYTCENGWLTCKHYCDCDYTYSSPCNPPHEHCGGDVHDSKAIESSWYDDSQASCYASGWFFCRKQTSLSALQKCTAYCKAKAQKRTLDCPGCPKP